MMNYESMTGKTVTLIIHGTSASEESWWRLGEGNHKTFADRLETALKKRDLPGTVWTPARKEGFSYEDFSWTGENRHRARNEGGKKLAKSINELANKVKANNEQPLTINFVAHSHGGNVVLEALRHLNETVSVGRCVMLGTPLISFSPAFRLGRLFLAVSVLPLAFLYLSMVLWLLALLYPIVFGCEFFNWTFCKGLREDGVLAPLFDSDLTIRVVTPFALVFFFVFWAWVVSFLAFTADAVWYLALNVSLWFFNRNAGQAYGPPPAVLAKRLGMEPCGKKPKRVVLLTSQFDEAKLLLQFGAEPNQLYPILTDGNRSDKFRFIWCFMLFPVVELFFLKIVESVLERFVLGFSWWRVLFLDYESSDPPNSRAYPNRLFKQVHLEEILSADALNEMQKSERPTTNEGTMASSVRQALTPLMTLKMAINEIKAQVKLKHGQYHKSDEVIDFVAKSLTSSET